MPSVREFLEAVLGEKPDSDLYAELKPIPVQKGRPVPTFYRYPGELDSLVARAAELSGQQNVYFGTSLYRERRGLNENVASCHSLFVDIDFKTTPLEKAKELLKAFPLKASIVVFTGGGLHVYWRLKEPVLDRELLRKDGKVQMFNKALANAVGGDRTTNTAWVLRVPGTTNLKYTPPPVVEVKVWRPELEYTLWDFEKYLQVDEPAPAAAPATADSSPVPAEAGPADVDKLPLPEILKRIIKEGLSTYVEYRRQTDPPEQFAARKAENRLSRSDADAYVVTSLMKNGIGRDQIFGIYRNPAYHIGEKYRERKDSDAYLDYTIQSCAKVISWQPKSSLNTLADKVSKKLQSEFGTDDFRVLRIVKTTFEPPIYEVTCKMPDGTEKTTKASLEDLCIYPAFRRIFFSTHDVFPPAMKNGAWERALQLCTTFDKKIVPAEVAGVRGEVAAALDEWIHTAKTTKEIGAEGGNLLDYFPVREDDGVVNIRLKALQALLKSQGIEANRQVVKDILQMRGFKHGLKRFGQVVARVWEIGNGHVADDEKVDVQRDLGFGKPPAV